jgi:ankyrin repeat protein
MTPLDIACKKGFDEIVSLLLNAGVELCSEVNKFALLFPHLMSQSLAGWLLIGSKIFDSTQLCLPIRQPEECLPSLATRC